MPLKPRKEGFQLPARSGPSVGELLQNPDLYPEEYARFQQAVLPVIEAAKRTVESPEFQAMIRQIIENAQRLVEDIAKLLGSFDWAKWAEQYTVTAQQFQKWSVQYAVTPEQLQLPAPQPRRLRPRKSELDALQAKVDKLERERHELKAQLAFESVEYPQLPPELFSQN